MVEFLLLFYSHIQPSFRSQSCKHYCLVLHHYQKYSQTGLVFDLPVDIANITEVSTSCLLYCLLMYVQHMVVLCIVIAYCTAKVKGIHVLVLNCAIFHYQLTYDKLMYHLLVVYLLCKYDSYLLSTGICCFSSELTIIVSYSYFLALLY